MWAIMKEEASLKSLARETLGGDGAKALGVPELAREHGGLGCDRAPVEGTKNLVGLWRVV